jgi:hypothetical protein
MGWNELQTRDSEAAGDFYGGLFGWETEPIEVDGRLVYTTIKNSGNQNGGFMPMAEQHGDAPFFWLPYFTVSSRDAAMEKARALTVPCWLGPWISLLARSPSLAIPRAPRSRSSRGRPTSRSAQLYGRGDTR